MNKECNKIEFAGWEDFSTRAPLADAVARIPGILGDQEILAVRCIVSLNVIDLKKGYPRVQILETDGANDKKSQHSFVRWGPLPTPQS